MLNDPKNPYPYGSALASRHDKNYEDSMARQAARREELARQFCAIVNPPPAAPKKLIPSIKVADPGHYGSSLPSYVRGERGHDRSAANKLWNFVWKSCGVIMALSLLAALG